MARSKLKCAFWAFVVVVLMLIARGAMAQPPFSDDMGWWVVRELDALRAEVIATRESLAEAREEVSGLKGWIAAAAGVPLASGGGLMAWRKRKNGRK